MLFEETSCVVAMAAATLSRYRTSDPPRVVRFAGDSSASVEPYDGVAREE